MLAGGPSECQPVPGEPERVPLVRSQPLIQAPEIGPPLNASSYLDTRRDRKILTCPNKILEGGIDGELTHPLICVLLFDSRMKSAYRTLPHTARIQPDTSLAFPKLGAKDGEFCWQWPPVNLGKWLLPPSMGGFGKDEHACA